MGDLLDIRNLAVDFMAPEGIMYALCGVDLTIGKGEIHGLVGESSCGKSTAAKAILGLHNKKRTRIKGEILFEGSDILAMPPREVAKLRGSAISIIFQDPMASLNPLMGIGSQIAEMYRLHENASKRLAREKAAAMLEKVGLTPSELRYKQYPFELSGGMQQRAMIAMAISCSPKLLIADEPTTALDATIQAQILELVKSVSDEMGMSVLLITHNFGIIAELCKRVSVMYAGRVVETGDTQELLASPKHPYTIDLIASIPRLENSSEKLTSIAGSPKALYEPPVGCQYYSRCSRRLDICEKQYPETRDVGAGHKAACHWSHSA